MRWCTRAIIPWRTICWGYALLRSVDCMRRLAKRILGGSKFRLRRFVTRVVALILPYLPPRLILNILMFAQAVHLPGQRLLLQHLISAAVTRPGQKLQISLTTNGGKWMPEVLHALGRHH